MRSRLPWYIQWNKNITDLFIFNLQARLGLEGTMQVASFNRRTEIKKKPDGNKFLPQYCLRNIPGT